MKSVFFVVAVALLVIAQINAYSVNCKNHFVTKTNASCMDFQLGRTGLRVRINDLTGMNPLINCNDVDRKVIKKGTRICVLPYFDNNKTIDKYTIRKKMTCSDLAKKLGLKPNQAYVIDNFNRALTCEIIKKQAGNEIDYCIDGNYRPNFSRSKRVYKEEDMDYNN